MNGESCILKIDPEFRRLVFPLSPEEYAALERRILQHGCSQPVVAWYGCIMQGFAQYEICKMRDIAFQVKNISFCVREEAISITCREELRSRHLPENQRRYLIGKRYNADVIIEAHNAAGTDQFKERNRRDLAKGKKYYESSGGRTKERIAEEYGLSRCSVTRYGIYAQAIDYIASIQPDTAVLILAGGTKISTESVMACYGKTEEEVAQLLTASRERGRMKKQVLEVKETVKSMSIKDMPVFDPDAEINSLALTIPSWISSIDRTQSAAQFPLLTIKGKKQLEHQLYQLQKAIQIMLHALEEVR